MPDPEASHHIPYQAYKSKRHSRNVSNSHLVPNVSPPPISRPSSMIGTPSPQHLRHHGSGEKETTFACPNGTRPSSKSPPPTSPVVLDPPPVSNGLITPPESDSHESPPSPVTSSNASSITLQSPAAVISSIPPPTNGKIEHGNGNAGGPVISPSSPSTSPSPPFAKDSTSTSAFASSSASTSTTTPDPKTQTPATPPTRKPSTFRHIPLRNSRSPLPSSPLRPGSATHSRSTSLSSAGLLSDKPQTQFQTHQQRPSDSRVRITSLSSISGPSGNDRNLPVIPPLGDFLPSTSSAITSNVANAPTLQPSQTNKRHSAAAAAPGITPPQRTSSLHPSAPPSVPSPSLTPSTSTSSSHTATTSTPASRPASTPPAIAPQKYQRAPAPYRPGFQPKGVYRPRTDEFVDFRRAKRDGGNGAQRVERTKLERRLEKLIVLHFPVPGSERGKEKEREQHKETLEGRRRPGVGAAERANRRASSIFDLDLKDLRSMSIGVDAGGLWRGVLGQGQGGKGGKGDIRAAEQRITPWQEDSTVSKCPLCVASFHPLTNRKHHCRLCGQIICSLPIKHPQRPATCSLLFVVDLKTRKIEEVGEGVDYGVRKRRGRSEIPVAGVTGKDGKSGEQQEQEQEEKFLKGVRICRQCRPVLLRQQYQQEVMHVPTLVKLYESFIALEKEIEDSLPQFQELILSLSHDDQPTKEASAARKRLLEGFAQYDSLSKRIQRLPCENGPGSSQHRVQMAIMNRANMFLQKNMFPLQSLPTPKRSKTSASTPTPTAEVTDGSLIDPDSEVAHALQPLLEQEALLESFVEEAKAHRKFEDAKTLKANLGEIQAEIEKILVNAEGGMHEGGARKGKKGKKGGVAG